MLPVPNLDDRLYQEIVAGARKSIPKLLPPWTDENAHDPGMTLIELLAWLSEMQQYYLNRITAKNEMKFLKLLGVRLREAERARTDATFSGASKQMTIPEGTRLLAADQAFETLEPLLLLPCEVEKVVVRSAVDALDLTSSNQQQRMEYYAFGPQPKKDNQLLIAFDRELPVNQTIALHIHLFDQYPVKLNPAPGGEMEIIPSGRVSWKYFALQEERDEGNGWRPLEIVRDETVHFSKAGRLAFRLTRPMAATTIHPVGGKRRWWICCTVEDDSFEVAPKIERITINTVPVLQQKTFSRVTDVDSTGEPGQWVELADYTSFHERIAVQIGQDDGGWMYWDETADFGGEGPDARSYMVMKDEDAQTTFVIFGDGVHGSVPPEGKNRIRVISFAESFASSRMIGQSKGLPGQRYRLQPIPQRMDGFVLQVGTKPAGDGAMIWHDWKLVDDFDNSGSYDRHFMLDAESGEILFGDNERGWIPPASEAPNICVAMLKIGGGSRGNVKEHMIRVVDSRQAGLEELQVTNHGVAAGGSEKESLEDAKHRVKHEVKAPMRAVTNRDLEEIALRTPGLRIARVKAIPLYEKGMRDYPAQKAQGQVTVVVVPYSEMQKPLPSAGFLETVKNYLDHYRLLTTELHVIPPEYIKITVHAVVVVDPSLKADSGPIVRALYDLLDPLDQKDSRKGWEFGRSVYKGDIFGAINRIEGVHYIQDLWIDAEGTGIQRDANGDILIPPYGLVYSGEHEVQAISRTDV